MNFEFCPSCGAKRSDASELCRMCGFDFGGPNGGAASERDRGSAPVPPSGWAVDRVPPPAPPQWQHPVPQQVVSRQVDVRPVSDRRNIARWTANALDVRCAGSAGGCLGMFVGFFAGALVGGAIGGFAALVTIPIGVLWACWWARESCSE